MSLKIKVKVGQVSNLSDARYCAGMGVDILGFCIDPGNPHYVTPELFHAIKGWVAGIEIAVETGLSTTPELLAEYEAQRVQVRDIGLGRQLREQGLNVILARDLDLEAYSQLHLEKLVNDAGEFEWINLTSNTQPDNVMGKGLMTNILQDIGRISQQHNIMLGFGVVSRNLDHILDAGIQAIELSGSPESRPGYQNYDDLADILEALEMD